MPDRRIGVVFGTTVNLGNYNSVKVQASYEEDVPDGIEAEEAYKALWNLCFSEVDKAVEAFKNRRFKQMESQKKTSNVI